MVFWTVISARAIPIEEFKGWDDLIKHSPEIFIARCVNTLDFISASNRIAVVADNVIHSDVEVISVLKGTPSSGVSPLGSQYWPYRGEYFMVFASCEKNQFNSGYTAVETYRIVPLDHNFMTNRLSGKTLNEQIDLVLAQRLQDLRGKLADDREEAFRLEKKLQADGCETDVSTNLPSTNPRLKPHGSEF